MATIMKKRLFVFCLVLLLGTAFSLAEEAEKGGVKQDSTEKASSESSIASFPWNISAGFGDGYSISTEWVFIGLAEIWHSNQQGLMWAVRNQLIWSEDNFGVFWQPSIYYMATLFFSAAIGPEIGFWIDKSFDYGLSVRIGTIFNLIGGELGYLANKKVVVARFLVSIPVGI